MALTSKEVLLDAYLGEYLIRKEQKKIHKIKDNANSLRQSLRNSILFIYKKYIVPKKVIVPDLGENVDFIFENPYFEINFKACTELNKNDYDFYSISVRDNIFTKIAISLSSLVPPETIKWKFRGDTNWYFPHKNSIGLNFISSGGGWDNSSRYAFFGFSALLDGYYPIIEKIIPLQLNASRVSYINSDSVSLNGIVDFKYMAKTTHNCQSLPVDMSNSIPFVAPSVLIKNTVNNPDVELKEKFTAEICNFISGVCKEERIEIILGEKYFNCVSLDTKFMNLSFEIGFDVSYYDFKYTKSIMRLVKEYIDFCLIYESRKSYNIIENKDLLSLPIFNDLFTFVLKVLLPKIKKCQVEFYSSYANVDFTTLDFMIFTFNSMDSNNPDSRIKKLESSESNLYTETTIDHSYIFKDRKNDAVLFKKIYGENFVYNNCSHWTYIGDKISEGLTHKLELKIDNESSVFTIKTFLETLSIIDGNIVQNPVGE